ncbi:riboflavin synthase [Zhihengliuella flava]|uniref:Riboflavin synthase n=1 Tax=Zhihengliuella flava TaxID=1285193 RepID=A0A931DDZ7_9MICC|nr:riboflavin synthase [Zhihengliuella flava]MBG6085721.1 riboflavin synthase [Zhihengliuella flava]
MFTGIVTGKGRVEAIAEQPGAGTTRLRISAPGHVDDLELGGSLAVNGVCLSATSIEGEVVGLDVIGETLRLTTTGSLQVGDEVNLERCLPAHGRLDGHIVQGHVDGVGELLERAAEGQWERLRFGVPTPLARYIATKGSIAIDGVSLTVTGVSAPDAAQQWFEVGLIPMTLRETVLGHRRVGEAVNLEVDVIAKYAERLTSFLDHGGQS